MGRWLAMAALLALGAAGCGQPITVRGARERLEPASQAQAGLAPATTLLRDLALEASALPAPRRQVVEVALAMTGARAGERDCSRFAVEVFANAGYPLPRTVTEQLRAGNAVEQAALAPGDLVFFTFERGPADHVGIYAGRDTFVHVSASTRRVRLETLRDPAFARTCVAARRVLE